MRDLMPIANDAFRLAVEQLEEVQEYVDLDDLLRLSSACCATGAISRRCSTSSRA